MRKMTFLLLGSCLLATLNVCSQGCIAVRNISGFGQYNLADNAFSTSDWLLNINNRYFKAFRDYKETHDQHTPPENENQIKSYGMDIGITRLLRNGWSLDFSLPIASNSRTTNSEHGGPNTPRYTTRSFGIGDIRITAYKWLLAATVKQKANIQLGLGIKLPTGDYKYQDHFHWNDSTVVLAPVNPSIQLGDGGTGLITELNAFWFLNSTYTISLYGNFYYMANPREQNGVPASLGGKPIPKIVVEAGGAEVSVPDVFSMRAGANFNFSQWVFSLGLRNEGIPVHDLLGGSLGTRRAGYTLSVEPGLVFKMKRASLYAYVPVTASHAIKQNLVDKEISILTHAPVVGAGGSGDYQVFVGASFKL
ncbi:MAG: hypothetical protein ACXVBJ_13620 [Flavisolibacter sp.]